MKHRGQYPDDWPIISHEVKVAAHWRCKRCDHLHDVMAGYMLTVHHLDLDKSNNQWWNLIALCQRCHLHIQGHLKLDQPWMFEHSQWIRPYLAGYYAHLTNKSESVDYVLAHQAELINFWR